MRKNHKVFFSIFFTYFVSRKKPVLTRRVNSINNHHPTTMKESIKSYELRYYIRKRFLFTFIICCPGSEKKTSLTLFFKGIALYSAFSCHRSLLLKLVPTIKSLHCTTYIKDRSTTINIGEIFILTMLEYATYEWCDLVNEHRETGQHLVCCSVSHSITRLPLYMITGGKPHTCLHICMF